jgi:prefoldin subunit 5
MQNNDQLLARDARGKFNERAAESLQHHRDDLDERRESADNAVQDLNTRRKYRRKRAEATLAKSKVA